MLTGGDKWLPTSVCVEPRCKVPRLGEDMLARSAMLPLILVADEFL